MNKKELVSFIQRIVQEEVEKEVKRNIGLIERKISKTFKTTLTEVFDHIDINSKSALVKKTNGKSTIKVKEKQSTKRPTNGIKWNTGNTMVDQILSETTKTIPQGDSTPFSTIDASEPSIIESEEVPEELKEVFTRNYSDLMKAITKK